MNARHTLICFFVLALQAGNTGLLTAAHRIKSQTEGEDITVACSFTSSGDTKFFCKQDCKEDVVIETTSGEAKNGRYRIEYSKTFFMSFPVLYVTIKQLTKSDSGWYRCGLGTPLSPDSHEDFQLIVRDALRPLSTSVPSTSTPTTTQSLSSSSGGVASSSASPKTTEQSGQQQPERTAAAAAAAAAGSGTLLYVGLCVVAVIFLLSLAGLLFCRRAGGERPLDMEYASVSNANRVHEDITAPVEMSSVYTHAKNTKPDGVETPDNDSSVTAAGPQNTVDFPNSTTALLNSAPAGNSNDVVSSGP